MDQIRQKFLEWDKSKTNGHLNDLFQEIWEIYHPKLQVYVRQIYHCGEKQDLVSDILLHVFETIDRYKSSYSFSTWIYTVARNYTIDLIRKKTIHPENIDDFIP